MSPSTASASEMSSASQALTTATADLEDAERLTRVYSQVLQKSRETGMVRTYQVAERMKRYDDAIMTRLNDNVSEKQSRLTKASAAYTVVSADETTLNRSKPKQVFTNNEKTALMKVVNDAQEDIREAVSDYHLEILYVAFEDLLEKHEYEA